MTSSDVAALYDEYILPCYGRAGLTPVRGEGSRLWDADGREYLDLFPGWGVSVLGHSHPALIQALTTQAQLLWHQPNSFYNTLQARLAQRLVEASFSGKAFFCNSGAEANEMAVKLARRYGRDERYEVITLEGAFHGRTLGMIAATGRAAYQRGFGPLLEGFRSVPSNDIEAMKAAVGPQTVAIMLEPIQGEGGVCVLEAEYLREIQALAQQHDLLLIFDEVQTGIGRTGHLFAFQESGVTPDIMTLAKALGGGFPIGATIARPEVADLLQPGDHGCTYGGNPLACACALAVLDTLEQEQLVEGAARLGRWLNEQLQAMVDRHTIVQEVRGHGLMQGIQLLEDGRPIADACLQNGLIINCTQTTVLRMLPALTVTEAELEEGLAILDQVLSQVSASVSTKEQLS